MAIFRVTWEFIGPNGQQWNEQYHWEGSTPGAASTVTTDTRNARLAFLHPLNMLLAVRSTQVDAQRVTGFTKYRLAGTAVGTFGPEVNSTAVVCGLSTATAGSRKIWFRGVPDNMVVRSTTTGLDAPEASTLLLLKTFFDQIRLEGYGMRKLQPKGVGLLENLKIISVDGTARDGTSTVTLSRAPGYAYPSRVVIGGASKKDLPQLNGHWQLLAAPVGVTVRIPYQTPQGLLVTGGNGYMRQELYGAFGIFVPGACGFSNFGSRDTRTPLSRSRGARRAARLRTSL